jgi:hypothetical protein
MAAFLADQQRGWRLARDCSMREQQKAVSRQRTKLHRRWPGFVDPRWH